MLINGGQTFGIRGAASFGIGGSVLSEYPGWCATGIAVGAKFRTDPNKFLVRDGNLYLFLYDIEVDALQLWLDDEKGMTAKAKENWKKM